MANANYIASNALSSIQSGGQALTEEQKQQQALAEQRRQQSADYLNNIEDPMAQGNGGYNADESSAIQDTGGINKLSGQYGDLSKQVGGLYNPDEVSPSADFLAQQQLTPAQQQDIVTGAGITAGTGAQAAKDAVSRATAATGGNPEALATYRARLDRQGAGAAADAMTQARIGASNAARTDAANAEQMREAGGTNKFNQGNTVANEQAGLVGQQAGLENEGSTRAGTVANTRLGTQQNALNYYQGQNAQADTDAQNSQNRQQQTYQTQTGGTNAAANTAVSASQTPSTLDKVIGAASGAIGGLVKKLADGDFLAGDDPFMGDDGVDAIIGEDGPEKVVQNSPVIGDGDDVAAASNQKIPFWKRLAQKSAQSQRQSSAQLPQPGQAGSQSSRPWSPVDTYSNLGHAAGTLAKAAFAADGIFTKPTHIRLEPGESVVPLNYRPGAKVRPSMAALPAARVRQPFGAIKASRAK